MNKREKVVIQGTPIEAGAQVWTKLCLPALTAAKGRPPEELAQFYAGVVGAAMGSMTADFGHELAVAIMRRTTEQFAAMGDAFNAAGKH